MSAVYLYCLVKRGRKPSSAKAPAGLPGASRPEAVNVIGSVWMVVADVPLEIYGPGHLDRHLADLDWVGRVALAHEAVVEHFTQAAGTTVIPMKLFTMFSTRARAVADVAARRKTIEASLRRIAGAEEWGIRVLRGEPVQRRPSPRRRAGSGAEFLAAKKEARDAARSSKQAAAGAALRAYERLSKLSKDSRRRHDAPAAGTAPPLLDAAFLVASTKRTKFTATARREAAACAAAGARMTLSGPWPAYNFVQPDDWSR